ncbi:MAG: hypothetical protein ACRDS0_22615 [Pseudonocardiaceae bacterium]
MKLDPNNPQPPYKQALARDLGATHRMIGMILGISGVGSLLGALLAPRLIRTIPAGRLIIVGAWVRRALLVLLAPVTSTVLLAPIAAGIAAVGPVWAVVALARRLGNLRCAGQRLPDHRSHGHRQPNDSTC